MQAGVKNTQMVVCLAEGPGSKLGAVMLDNGIGLSGVHRYNKEQLVLSERLLQKTVELKGAILRWSRFVFSWRRILPRLVPDIVGIARTCPSLWNSIPHHLRSTDSYTVFKSNLKTHLFSGASISGP